MRLIPITCTTAAILLLGACSSSGPLVAPEGFPSLSVKADEENTLIFVKPNLNLSKYALIYVAPVRVQMNDGKETKDVTSDEAKALALYTESKLKDNLAKRFYMADAPGDGVLTVQFMIADLEPTSKAQIAMLVPPFALINMVSSKGVFLGSITLAGRLYEGNSTQPSVAFVGLRSRPGIDAGSAFGRWTVAEKVIDGATERLAEDLNRHRSETSY